MSFKKNLISFFVIGIIGAVSHFVYGWSGENAFVGLFFPVNESIWEHLKLIFFPAGIYFLIEYFLMEENQENYIFASIKSIFCGMFTIVTIYYVITGVLGKNVDFINITIYFIALITVIAKRNKLLQAQENYSKTFTLILSFLAVITTVLFMVWSYNPPLLGIFAIP